MNELETKVEVTLTGMLVKRTPSLKEITNIGPIGPKCAASTGTLV
jgi:hypothetical protein